jgi:putative addiction module antidote
MSGDRRSFLAITVKVTTVGNSTGIVLPRELLEKLRVQKGDLLHVLETPGGIELTAFDPEFARQMDVAERVMRQDRDILNRLAK